MRSDAREHRAALGRVVRYFVHEAGNTRFLDIGTGIPRENSVHEVAKRELPDARVVHADCSRSALAHPVGGSEMPSLRDGMMLRRNADT